MDWYAFEKAEQKGSRSIIKLTESRELGFLNSVSIMRCLLGDLLIGARKFSKDFWRNYKIPYSLIFCWVAPWVEFGVVILFHRSLDLWNSKVWMLAHPMKISTEDFEEESAIRTQSLVWYNSSSIHPNQCWPRRLSWDVSKLHQLLLLRVSL